MKTCDICHEPIGMFNKFRYADGYICKACYKKPAGIIQRPLPRRSWTN